MQEAMQRLWGYARGQYWELPASILEGLTLVGGLGGLGWHRSTQHEPRSDSPNPSSPPLCVLLQPPGAACVCARCGIQGVRYRVCSPAVHQLGPPRAGVQGRPVQGTVIHQNQAHNRGACNSVHIRTGQWQTYIRYYRSLQYGSGHGGGGGGAHPAAAAPSSVCLLNPPCCPTCCCPCRCGPR